MDEYLAVTLYYLHIRHKDPTADKEVYRNMAMFDANYIEPFRKAVKHNPSAQGKDWNQETKVQMMKDQLSDFSNNGKLMAMLIHHMCHRSVLR